jgi:hypothetical protein
MRSTMAIRHLEVKYAELAAFVDEFSPDYVMSTFFREFKNLIVVLYADTTFSLCERQMSILISVADQRMLPSNAVRRDRIVAAMDAEMVTYHHEP